jgi:hypothetical protein
MRNISRAGFGRSNRYPIALDQPKAARRSGRLSYLILAGVVIGHVPVDAIRALAERLKIVGISTLKPAAARLPGIRFQPVAIYEITADGRPSKIFMTVP